MTAIRRNEKLNLEFLQKNSYLTSLQKTWRDFIFLLPIYKVTQPSIQYFMIYTTKLNKVWYWNKRLGSFDQIELICRKPSWICQKSTHPLISSLSEKSFLASRWCLEICLFKRLSSSYDFSHLGQSCNLTSSCSFFWSILGLYSGILGPVLCWIEMCWFNLNLVLKTFPQFSQGYFTLKPFFCLLIQISGEDFESVNSEKRIEKIKIETICIKSNLNYSGTPD